MSTSKKDLSWQGAHKLNPSGPQHEARCSPACRHAPSTKAIAPCPRLRSLGSRGRGSTFQIDPTMALGIRISSILMGVARARNEIGRESCRDRECQNMVLSVVD